MVERNLGEECSTELIVVQDVFYLHSDMTETSRRIDGQYHVTLNAPLLIIATNITHGSDGADKSRHDSTLLVRIRSGRVLFGRQCTSAHRRR